MRKAQRADMVAETSAHRWNAARLLCIAAACLLAACGKRVESNARFGPAAGTLLVAAQAEPDGGEAPLEVEFEAEIYEGDQPVQPVFEWDFGDGSKVKKGSRVKHTFRQPGMYTVIVRATDATGRRGMDEIDITVEPRFGSP